MAVITRGMVAGGVEIGLLDAAFGVVAEGVASGALPSGVLAVADSKETWRIEAYGPVESDSIFLIASITKPIVATGIMRLVERGHLLLNDPVAAVLPEFAAKGKADVRVWHLLTHTSGIDEPWTGRPDPGWPNYKLALERACAAPLRFRPGTHYQYCSVSFYVLGELIRRVSGRDHPSYLREEVLEPLGMHATSFLPPESPRVVPVHDAP